LFVLSAAMTSSRGTAAANLLAFSRQLNCFSVKSKESGEKADFAGESAIVLSIAAHTSLECH
jgi:hypothetical protein